MGRKYVRMYVFLSPLNEGGKYNSLMGGCLYEYLTDLKLGPFSRSPGYGPKQYPYSWSALNKACFNWIIVELVFLLEILRFNISIQSHGFHHDIFMCVCV